MVSTPMEANTSSKLAVNLVSRSRMRNRSRRPASSEVGGEVASHLCDPWTVRLVVAPRTCTTPALRFDDEQHVVAPKEDGLDVEEVRGHNSFGLGREELGPGRALSPGAGGRPWRRSTVATLVFDTQTPSFFSSPTMRR